MKTFDQFLDERLGGKGYSKQAAASSVYPGKKGTGDWEDSDRGAGNKSARRAGKKVEKKSPTYKAHVLNKESVGGGVPLTPPELEIQKKMSRLNVRLARKRSQEMQKAKVKDTETAPEQVKEASAVLDANTKIKNKDDRKKKEAELRRLLNHAIAMKKGRAESVEPEGGIVEGDVHSGQGEKIQKRTKKWMDKKGQKGAPGLDAMKARTAEHKAKRGVKEDKAFEYVKKQIAAKYGKSGYVSKDNPRKPQTDAEKAKVRAHQAKVDKENAAERAKDPSQGRYPKG